MNDKTGRNDPCPCGSGKKYKRCCLGKEPPKPLATQVPPRKWAPGPDPRSFQALEELKVAREPATGPRDEWDDWHDRYDASEPAAKLDMLRALLAEDRPAEFYGDMDFVGAVLEFPGGTSEDAEASHTAFLEELFASRPGVFILGAAYFVRDMAYAYVRTGRERDIARLLPCLLDETQSPDSPVFDLIDLLRLAGLYEESRSLTFATVKQAGHGGLMGWAVDELIETAVFFLDHEAIEAGATPEAMDDLRRKLALIDCRPSEERLTAILAHRSGKTERPLERKDLLAPDESAGFNLYLLSLDFGYWLTKERRMPPLVADAMRYFACICLGRMREESDRDPLALHQQRLDKYLAGLMGFASLHQLRAVATLIAIRHFYDFLRSSNLLDEGGHRRAMRICDDLWSQMHGVLGEMAPQFAFLNRYL